MLRVSTVHMILGALLAQGGAAAQESISPEEAIQAAGRLASQGLALEKQGRVLEARREYEQVTAVLSGSVSRYEAAIISATAYLDVARMRIEGANRYGQSVDREANLNAIFDNLARVEATLAGGLRDAIPRAPLVGGGSFFGQRFLIMARLHFVRGNLDQSSVELQKSLEMFRTFQKDSAPNDPEVARIISYIQGVDRQVRDSPLSRNNLVETAKSLSKLVPTVGAFLPEVISIVDKYQRSNQTHPRL